MNNPLEQFNLLELDTYLSIEPLSWPSILICILSAGIIGLERQFKGKPIGIRTSILICLGTYTFVVIGASIADETTDPSRVIGQIITGIGFLGAGVILAKEGNVVGVTSAACIWMLAAIGVIIGTQHPAVAVKVSILTVLLLVALNYLESSFKNLQRGVHRPQFRRHSRKSLSAEKKLEDDVDVDCEQ